MSDNQVAAAGIVSVLMVMIMLLFKMNIAHAEEKEIKPVRPKEVIIQESYQKKLPKEKRYNLDCKPDMDIFHQPSCIIV